MAKAVLPHTKYYLLNSCLKNAFGTPEAGAWLVNPTTLKKENVKIDSETHDRWYSTNGLEKVINALQEPATRLNPVMINDYYLALVYRPKTELVFRIFNDIEELPEGFNKEDVHPITLCELVYLSNYRAWNKFGCYFTRYPIIGMGSIYPGTPYIKTTIRGEMRYELDAGWQKAGDEFVALEYPTFDNPVFVDTLIPHPSRLKGLDGDFDGDTASFNVVYTDEAIEEVHAKLRKRDTYVNTEGGLVNSAVVDTVERVLRSMTGP
jgi:hypothetical protein